MKNSKGKLYICPTPIGNLEDITLRSLRILKEVDFIAAEDTRITQKLLNHYNISTPLISYHKFSDKKKLDIIIDLLTEGKTIALVSDSGTPIISDPGNEIIKESIRKHIEIIPIPGPSAVICSLSASGLLSDGFIFYGFLPRNKKEIQNLLGKLSKNNLPLVFFESPNRVIDSLEVILETLGNINVVIARELTKIHEEIRHEPLDKAIEHFKNTSPRGEFTIIIDKTEPQNIVLTEEEITELIKERLSNKQTLSSIAKELSNDFELNKNYVYKLALSLTKED